MNWSYRTKQSRFYYGTLLIKPTITFLYIDIKRNIHFFKNFLNTAIRLTQKQTVFHDFPEALQRNGRDIFWLIRQKVIKIEHGIRTGDNPYNPAVFHYRKPTDIMLHHQSGGLLGAFAGFDRQNFITHKGFDGRTQLGIIFYLAKIPPVITGNDIKSLIWTEAC